jgi:hypothetical protein
MPALRRYFLLLSALAIVSIGLNAVLPWNLSVTALALFVGWPLVGTLITIDDDFPGGWSNPDGKARPEWKTAIWWADILLCRGAFVVAAAAFDARADERQTIELIAAAVAMAATGFPLVIRSLRLHDTANS